MPTENIFPLDAPVPLTTPKAIPRFTRTWTEEEMEHIYQVEQQKITEQCGIAPAQYTFNHELNYFSIVLLIGITTLAIVLWRTEHEGIKRVFSSIGHFLRHRGILTLFILLVTIFLGATIINSLNGSQKSELHRTMRNIKKGVSKQFTLYSKKISSITPEYRQYQICAMNARSMPNPAGK